MNDDRQEHAVEVEIEWRGLVPTESDQDTTNISRAFASSWSSVR